MEANSESTDSVATLLQNPNLRRTQTFRQSPFPMGFCDDLRLPESSLSGLNRGLLCRHAYPLTTWGAIFVYCQRLHDDDFRTGPLPFVERNGSHHLRWPYRLVSEFLPPLLLRGESFFVATASFSTTGLGLSQRSRACNRRPSEAGHFYVWGSHLWLRSNGSPCPPCKCCRSRSISVHLSNK